MMQSPIWKPSLNVGTCPCHYPWVSLMRGFFQDGDVVLRDWEAELKGPLFSTEEMGVHPGKVGVVSRGGPPRGA